MNLFGITGGIGSGKSTVASIFKTLGIPVYESDPRAKYLMTTNQEVRNRIIQLFGDDSYSANNELNASLIASKVFNDKVLLGHLNRIVHPAVYQDLISWSQKPDQKSSPYLIQESAILFEEDLTARLKGVILVVAHEEIRIQRVMKRDGVSKENVLQRIKNQWTDEKKIPLSDYVIFNDGDRSLIDQVRDIDEMIRKNLNG